MNHSDVLSLTQQALWMVVLLAGPPVIAAAIVGILVALFQAATQLQEQTFQYAAKFFAIAVSLFLTASLMGSTLFRFADRVFAALPGMAGN